MIRHAAKSLAVLALVTVLGSTAKAQELIFFIPPTKLDQNGVPQPDVVGTSDVELTNDGYAEGRGIVFLNNISRQILGVGIFLNVQNAQITATIAQATSLTGAVNPLNGPGQSASETKLVTTGSRQWVDFSTPFTLVAGQIYHINFSFPDESHVGRREFYRNSNIPWNQDENAFEIGPNETVFTQIDGTQALNTSNDVAPIVRLIIPEGGGQVEIAAPEPGTFALLGLGLIGGLTIARRRRH